MNDRPGNRNDRLMMDVALLVTRVVAGIIFVMHGAQKFGAFDGPGLKALAEMMGPIVYPVAIGELFGGLGLIAGFLSRFSAAALIVIMIGAIATVHGQHGFFLGDPPGYEYNVALIGLLTPTLLAGPGRFTLGRFILPRSKRTGRPILFLE